MMIRKVGNANTKKKLVIKGLSNVPKLPDNFNSTTWDKLSRSIKAIHDSEPVSESKETLYNSVKDLCLHKFAEETYKKLHDQYQLYMTEAGKNLHFNMKQGADTLSLLHNLHDIWNSHCQQIRMIRDIFLYLDRTYVFQTKIHSLWEMGCLLFRSEIMNDKIFVDSIVKGILSVFESDRKGEMIERSFLQNIVRMFIALKLYDDEFEGEFLCDTKEFYNLKGTEQLNNHDSAFYLSFCENCLKEEQERAKTHLSDSTSPKLLHIVEEQLIGNHAEEILDKGFFSMMDENELDNLKRCYNLLYKVKGLEYIKSFLNSYVQVRLYFQQLLYLI